MWAHTPVELLMVFRLREYLQLENPKVNHPLMNSALGLLPAEGSCEISDPVLQRTLERMCADGYDKERIVNEIVGAAPRK